MKKKLLIVGSFPKKPIFGGIQQSCKLIITSSFFSHFKLIPFDSSQISNPPPNFIVRLIYANIRILRFVYNLIIERPKVSLIFCSDGFSALEKGVMVYLSNFFGVKALIFPRAGNLINQVNEYLFFKHLIKILFKKATLFLAQGEKWNTFAQDTLEFPKESIKIIHNWSATKELIKIGYSRTYDNKDITKFLFVGWFEKEKGVYELLESIKLLSDKNLPFSITIIGNGNAMYDAQRFVNENQLTEKVIFEGWVPNDDIYEYYNSADIFVLPSWQEGMPNALIEALSCGLASIVTNVGMIPNYLQNELNAIIIPPKDSLTLYLAMEKLIMDKKLKVSISTNGHKLAKKYFNTEKGLESLSDTINSLM